MKISTFRASSLQAALQRVREELGPEASVLHMRELTERVGNGNSVQAVIEVDASLDLNVHSRFDAQVTTSDETPVSSEVELVTGDEAEHRDTRGQPNSLESPLEPSVELGTLDQKTESDPEPTILSFRATVPAATEVASVSHSVDDKSFKSGNSTVGQVSNVESPHREALIRQLVEHGMSTAIAANLMEQAVAKCTPNQLAEASVLQVSILEVMASKVKTGGSIELDENEPTVVAFVGPTGVGKTTTLAKVATNFRMDVGCQVGFVTMDTFRLGAVDQLLHYAEHLSAQLEVISSPEQLEPALLRLRECDLVLLDTAGRSTSDREQLSMLGELLEAAQPDATHLVLSADRSLRAAQEAVARFSEIAASHVIVSKLDEAVDFGSWWNLFATCDLPVSYLTTGQRMPNDLVPASGRRIAQAMLG